MMMAATRRAIARNVASIGETRGPNTGGIADA